MYQYVIVTHLPSFYKVNLYNALARQLKIHVIFLGGRSNIRTPDFTSNGFQFDVSFLSNDAFEKRNTAQTSLKIVQLLLKLKYEKLIVGGWEMPEFWLSIFLSKKAKNCLCLESGGESETKGFKGFIKRLFLSRVHRILATGEAQVALAQGLNFKDTVLKTHGVGLFAHPKSTHALKPFQGKFLFVGRLAQEKNIALLLKAFEKCPEYSLTVAGSGPLKIQPKSTNVQVVGHVPQRDIYKLYQQHDVLILPSLQEPWGLVVEEALFHGLPVLVSDRVGAKELVEHYHAGFVFNPLRLQDLLEKIIKIAQPEVFLAMQKGIAHDFMALRQRDQISVYEQALA